MAVKGQLIIKDAVTKWINQWIKRELRRARGTGMENQGGGEGDRELDEDDRPGWRDPDVSRLSHK